MTLTFASTYAHKGVMINPVAPDSEFTIRELAQEFDVTPRTLRFYEQKGMIHPVRRGASRIYSAIDHARIELILRGKRFGFSLEEIRQLLDLYDKGDQQLTQLTETYGLAEKRLSDLVQQRDELNEAIEELRDQINWGEKMIASIRQQKKAAE